ncbi:MAG: hypothetical protein ABIE22_05030 [archaeon]
MSRKECVNKYENEQDCPCDEINCERRGVCCECITYHRNYGDRPACIK